MTKQLKAESPHCQVIKKVATQKNHYFKRREIQYLIRTVEQFLFFFRIDTKSELHKALGQPQGELTQVEVRGLWRNGKCRGLGEHLTTNCGCRANGAAVHLLEGLAVAVHVSLEGGNNSMTDQIHHSVQ